jgi:hypothetical protein
VYERIDDISSKLGLMESTHCLVSRAEARDREYFPQRRIKEVNRAMKKLERRWNSIRSAFHYNTNTLNSEKDIAIMDDASCYYAFASKAIFVVRDQIVIAIKVEGPLIAVRAAQQRLYGRGKLFTHLRRN